MWQSLNDNEKTTETSCFLYLRISCQILIPAQYDQETFLCMNQYSGIGAAHFVETETDAVWEHRNLSCMCDMGFYIYQ